MREAVLDNLLVRFGNVPVEIEEAVNGVSDIERLRYLRRQAILVENLPEFAEELFSEAPDDE